MHDFAELVTLCTARTREALQRAGESAGEALDASGGATSATRALEVATLQRAIAAVGTFALFEARLQEQLAADDGFAAAQVALRTRGDTVLCDRLRDHCLAINVLKHGRGRSYSALLQRADTLPFRIRRDGEHFFFEGDVSEIATLVEVDDTFLDSCTETIRLVCDALRG